MLIDLTEAEMCFIREAVREFRIAAPEHISSDAGRLSRWRDERGLYDQDRISVDRKMTDAVVSIDDRKLALEPRTSPLPKSLP